MRARRCVSIAVFALGAASILSACGTSQPANAYGIPFAQCSFEATISETVGSGTSTSTLGAGGCSGGAISTGASPAAIDVDFDLGGGQAIHVTLTTSVAGLTRPISAIPGGVPDQDEYLGNFITPGTVWARHRYTTNAAANGALEFAPTRGTIVVGAIDVVPTECVDGACGDGTVAIDLTLQDVSWTSPAGPARYDGHVHVVASGTPISETCVTAEDCSFPPLTDGLNGSGPRGICNTVNAYAGFAYCGLPNASGAPAGKACSAASDCASGFCDPRLGECTASCGNDSGCTKGTRCIVAAGTEAFYPADSIPQLASECDRSCTTAADCADLPSAPNCDEGSSFNEYATSFPRVMVCGP